MKINSATEFAALADQVTALDIVRVQRHYDDRPADLVDGLLGESLGRLSHDAARELLAMVAALPPAETMRCHTPRYGFRLRLRGGEDAAVAICFRCNNARTFLESDLGWFAFDGESPEAKALLEIIKRHDSSAGIR